MKRFYIPKEEFNENNIVLSGVEHNHLKNVLRLKVGEQVVVVCGDGYDYVCEIGDIDKNYTRLNLVERTQNIYDSHSDVTFFQAMTKSDNMSLIIQKLTELGINTFYPFESTFITAKDKAGKSDKLQAISNQSIKQCKRSTPMKVMPALKFNDMVKKLAEFDVVIFANECEKSVNLDEIRLGSGQKVAIIVGSEGGFSADEIEKITTAGAHSVSLGKRILRAETAAIGLASVVMFLLGEWRYE